MRLKPAPRPARGAARRGSASAPRPAKPAEQARAKRGVAHARRRGVSGGLPRTPRLLSGGRLAATVLALAVAGALGFLVNGPWLRVSSFAWDGVRYTSADRLEAVLDPVRGESLLAVDARDLTARLRTIPAIADARVETRFPDGIAVEVTERVPALIWQTPAVRLVVDRDGVVFGEIALGARLTGEFATLPVVDDRRPASRDIIIGDRIPSAEMVTAATLGAIRPAALGSAAKAVAVRIDDRCGYEVLPRPTGSWTAVLGFYGVDAGEGAVAARISAQVAAVRTLFASHRENTVGWVDARNPGKVYWRPNGPGGTDAC